jgi:uncharacterized membrane protein HdeD (DUF308 family)
MSKNTKEKFFMKEKSIGLGGVFTVSAAFILLGLLLLFIPQIKPLYLAYILSIAFIVVGIMWIVQYFLTESYRNINRYGFSAGTLLVVLGICAMLKAEEISTYFLLCMGFLIMVMGIVQLQNALDLMALNDPMWKIVLGLSLAVILCAIIIVMNPFQTTENLARFTYIIMVIDGIFGIASMIFLAISLKNYEKNQGIKADEIQIPVEDIEVVDIPPESEEEEKSHEI